MWGEFWDKRAKRVKAKMDDAHIGDTVLDISSETGALATLLANIAKHVTAIEKMRDKKMVLLEIVVVLCLLFLEALPVIAAEQEMQKVSASEVKASDDFVLGIYGNANEDDTIDMRDVTYIKLVIFGKKPETDLCDANYDGRVSMLDVVQTLSLIHI